MEVVTKHNVKPHLVQAPRDCVRLYDILEIEDPIVSNCIVDQAAIEGILLLPNCERGIELLSKAANVPKNCHQGIAITGDRFYPDPNYRFYSNRQARAKFLQVDIKEHAIQLENSIRELQEKKRKLEGQFNEVSQSMAGTKSREQQLQDTIRKLQSSKNQLKRELQDLRNTAEPEMASVELLEQELEDIKTTLREKKAKAAELTTDMEEISTEIMQNEKKIKQLKESNSSFENRLRALEEQINEKNSKHKEISSREELEKRRISDEKEKLNETRAVLVVKQSDVKKCTDDAVALGERLETERKVPQIFADIQQMEKSVRKIETTTEDPEELLQIYQERKSRFDNAAECMRILKKALDSLGSCISRRKRKYGLTQQYYVTFVQHSFKRILQVRQFQGSMEIDMENKKLDMIVIPQHGSQGRTTVSNLSGGERSFSTVAFLYSLWQCMEFPFYFLDEFDVYMDKLNRTKVMDILIHHAESHPDLQFVFLTPQDVSFVKKDVPILSLEAPKRQDLV